jgi:hypothetical protein
LKPTNLRSETPAPVDYWAGLCPPPPRRRRSCAANICLHFPTLPLESSPTDQRNHGANDSHYSAASGFGGCATHSLAECLAPLFSSDVIPTSSPSVSAVVHTVHSVLPGWRLQISSGHDGLPPRGSTGRSTLLSSEPRSMIKSTHISVHPQRSLTV